MYVDEKQLNRLAEQVNAAFKAQELAMEELKAEIKNLKTTPVPKKLK
jgi:hypothetical protein